MKKLMALFLAAILCISACACGKEYDQAMELLELVEDHQYDAAHSLLNEMAGEDGTVWIPEYCVSDPWVNDNPCGDIGSGDDFWNGDDVCGNTDATCDNTVVEPEVIPIEGIKISQDVVTVTSVGETTVSASVYPENTTEYVSDIRWASSDESVVEVNEWSGKVTGVSKGTATLTATMGEHVATCTVNVVNPTISTVEEWVALKDIPRNVVYELVADLDMAGVEAPAWEDQISISGTLEGNGHKIYNLGYGPLIGVVESGGVLRNLIVECDITAISKVQTDTLYMGVIANSTYGLIERCISKGKVHVEYDYAYISGIVSSVGPRGKVYQCKNEIDFTLGGTVFNPLGVERNVYNAGAAGIAYSGESIIQCVNVGNATLLNAEGLSFGGITAEGAYIEDSYNMGGFTGNESGGGISIGHFGQMKNCINYAPVANALTRLQGGYIIDCYYAKDKCANGAFSSTTWGGEEDESSDRVRLYALSDEELTKQESYPTLDFENVWVMGPDGYPILKWQQEWNVTTN